jgi:hypothetical protein
MNNEEIVEALDKVMGYKNILNSEELMEFSKDVSRLMFKVQEPNVSKWVRRAVEYKVTAKWAAVATPFDVGYINLKAFMKIKKDLFSDD